MVGSAGETLAWHHQHGAYWFFLAPWWTPTSLKFLAIAAAAAVAARFAGDARGRRGWPWVLGGLLLGTGCLFLARHRSSLGGATIVSLYMQNRYGVRAGKVQLAIDCVVLLLALFVVPLERVFYSVLAAVVMGVFLWISHRPGRYVGG